MAGTSWAVLVLAEPLDESAISTLRHGVIEEMRSFASSSQASGAPSPLTNYYLELLQMSLVSLTEGQSAGAWRTGVYLLGDDASYFRLTGVWRGLFAGDQSLPEPLRIWDRVDVLDLASQWQLPDVPSKPGPGKYRRPFEYQTLLTSSQLANYVHLPQTETSGFTVELVPDFDVAPPKLTTNRTVSVGRVLERTRETIAEYAVDLESLKKHALVAGVTGSGKTNTIFHILKQLGALQVNFMIIEPAKAEYRALLNDQAIGSSLLVFTPGNDMISPLRLNPFEAIGTTPVIEHIDLLRSVFGASFGMWTPLPQVLERCLHEIYEDRGWNLTTGANRRLDGGSNREDAFPTLSDLVAKVDDVSGRLGYEERVTADFRAALTTRLNGLRAGGKGRMLDVQRSTPMKELLDSRIVLELQGMGDDDDKAFLIGLLLIRIAEYRRTPHEADRLQHVLVVEEAHRLLANPGARRSEEEADPRGKAVETFTNLLAEIRAYGQGVVIADQIPVKLAPDVIKNTELKIVHRIVAADDRAALAGAMAMDDRQARRLTTLTRGQAAAFSEEDDAPVLVLVPPAKGQPGQAIPDDTEVARRMATIADTGSIVGGVAGRPKPEDDDALVLARAIVDDRAFQRAFARVVQSTIEDPAALDRTWADVVDVVNARCSTVMDEQLLIEAVMREGAKWLGRRRGEQRTWSYSLTADFTQKLEAVLVAKVHGDAGKAARNAFQKLAYLAFARPFAPFAACTEICKQDPPVCLYRYGAADLIASGDMQDAWTAAAHTDVTEGKERRAHTWSASLTAAYSIIETTSGGTESTQEMQRMASDARRRAALCYAQQMLLNNPQIDPSSTRELMHTILSEASS